MVLNDSLKDMVMRAADNTANAFSKMTKKNIAVEYCVVEIKKLSNFTPIFNDEESVVGVSLGVSGRVPGKIFLAFPEDSAYIICDLMEEKQIGQTVQINQMDEDTLKEAGNIIAGSYLAVLSKHLKMKLIEQMPVYGFGSFGRLFKEFSRNLICQEKEVMVAEAVFVFEPIVIKSYLIIYFEQNILG